MSYAPTLICSLSSSYASQQQSVANGAWVDGSLPDVRFTGAVTAVDMGETCAALVSLSYQQASWRHLEMTAGMASASALQASKALGWGVPETVQLGADLTVQLFGNGLSAEHLVRAHSATRFLQAATNTPILTVDPFANRPDEKAQRAAELFTSLSAVIEFDDAPYIPGSIINWGGADLTKRPALPVFGGARISHRQPPERHRNTLNRWDTGPHVSTQADTPFLLGVVIPGATPPASKARTHIIMNTVQTFTLPAEVPLALADIRIDLDQDSFSWKLSCQALNAASAALLAPDASGRKELAIIINGHRWEFFVAKTAQSKQVDNQRLNQRYSITGYSRSQYLAEPYAPKRTRSIGTTTAVQAATDELVGTGFTLDWNVSNLPDWTMPNAVFSYQEQAPISVIKRLATAAGAIVQPATATNTLTVQPRHKVLPWELLGMALDRTIHESQILSEDHTDEPGTLFNQVFVSGESEGVSTTITRQGTAGDNPASDITDSWISAIECNISRGKAELAASGDRVIHTLELPVPETGNQPGLLLPGMTVAVQHDNSARNYRAYVTAVSISVPGRNNAKVRQTVTLDQPSGWEANA